MNPSSKILVVFLVVFCAINILDFVFYGQNIRHLAAAAGLALMAFGTYRNIQSASIIGAVIALGAIASKYLP